MQNDDGEYTLDVFILEGSPEVSKIICELTRNRNSEQDLFGEWYETSKESLLRRGFEIVNYKKILKNNRVMIIVDYQDINHTALTRHYFETDLEAQLNVRIGIDKSFNKPLTQRQIIEYFSGLSLPTVSYYEIEKR